MPENCTNVKTENEKAVEKAYQEEYFEELTENASSDRKVPEKSEKRALIAARIITVASMAVALAFGITSLKGYFESKKLKQELDDLENEYSMSVEEYENTIATMERTYVYDNGVSVQDVEIYENVPKNPYVTERFVTDDIGNKYYTDETGTYISTLGIDLSYYQGDVYWENVAASGVDFAMIRAGYRGYATGELMQDTRFLEYIQGASNAGLDIGIYFFSQAINEQEAIEEANYVLSMISEYDITYPIAFDWEYITTDEARTDDLPREQLTNAAIAFCETIKNAGYTPIIYGNAATLIFRFDLSLLGEYDFWLAQYYDAPQFYYDFKMWQYTSSGIVDGISNYVDMNVCMKKYNEE